MLLRMTIGYGMKDTWVSMIGARVDHGNMRMRIKGFLLITSLHCWVVYTCTSQFYCSSFITDWWWLDLEIDSNVF